MLTTCMNSKLLMLMIVLHLRRTCAHLHCLERCVARTSRMMRPWSRSRLRPFTSGCGCLMKQRVDKQVCQVILCFCPFTALCTSHKMMFHACCSHAKSPAICGGECSSTPSQSRANACMRPHQKMTEVLGCHATFQSNPVSMHGPCQHHLPYWV